MPTIVGILTFMSRLNSTSERLKARNFFICRYFSFYEQLKVSAQLSWAWQKFYNPGAWFYNSLQNSYVHTGLQIRVCNSHIVFVLFHRMYMRTRQSTSRSSEYSPSTHMESWNMNYPTPFNHRKYYYCMLGIFSRLCLSSADILQHYLFQKILWEIILECQKAWIQIRAWSGSKLFAKAISGRKNLQLAGKGF